MVNARVAVLEVAGLDYARSDTDEIATVGESVEGLEIFAADAIGRELGELIEKRAAGCSG